MLFPSLHIHARRRLSHKACHLRTCHRHSPLHWKLVAPFWISNFWKSVTPSKVLVFLWRLLQDCLPTCQQLSKRGISFKLLFGFWLRELLVLILIFLSCCLLDFGCLWTLCSDFENYHCGFILTLFFVFVSLFGFWNVFELAWWPTTWFEPCVIF